MLKRLSNMSTSFKVAGLASLTALTVGGYCLRSVFAAGIPAANAFTYSGVVTDDAGAPLVGKVVTVAIFDSATLGGGTQKCSGTGPATSGADGRFSIVLDAACVTAVKATPTLYAEVSVQGVAIGRTQIGAVPYAAASDSATQVTGSVASTQVTGSLPATQITSSGMTAQQRLDDLATRVTTLESAAPSVTSTSLAGPSTLASSTSTTTCTTTKKRLLVLASGTSEITGGSVYVQVALNIDGNQVASTYSQASGARLFVPTMSAYLTNVTATSHTIGISSLQGAQFDNRDFWTITCIEFP